MNWIRLGLFLVAGFCLDAVAAARVESIYTRLVGSSCSASIDDEISGAMTLHCPGVSGFQLHVLSDDERYSIDIVTPEGKILPLNYWDVLTHGFSSIGPKAEWRVARRSGKPVPIGLIVKLHTVDQSVLDRPRRVSYLAVAQIRGNEACVVAKLDAAQKTAASTARKIAGGNTLPCLDGDARGRN